MAFLWLMRPKGVRWAMTLRRRDMKASPGRSLRTIRLGRKPVKPQ
jgi:hypothetical protein